MGIEDLADRDIASIAKTTEFNCRPDAICVSGLTAGSETDTQVLNQVKNAVKKTPVLCNTGCNKDNIVRQLSASDGAVCATTFKVDGKSVADIQKNLADAATKNDVEAAFDAPKPTFAKDVLTAEAATGFKAK